MAFWFFFYWMFGLILGEMLIFSSLKANLLKHTTFGNTIMIQLQTEK